MDLASFPWNPEPDDISVLSCPYDIALNSRPFEGDWCPMMPHSTLPSQQVYDALSIPPLIIQHKLDLFINVLKKAIAIRIRTIPIKSCGGSRVGVLFSGGIDCMILAVLIDSIFDPSESIDLVNVAFENPRSISFISKSSSNATRSSIRKNTSNTLQHPDTVEVETTQSDDPYLVPDRKTSLRSLKELTRLCPNRKWIVKHRNVSFSTYLEHKRVVKNLVLPNDTVMDFSIGVALFFATLPSPSITHAFVIQSTSHHLIDENKGICASLKLPVGTCTDPRVWFSGFGADELFGGYKHHKPGVSLLSSIMKDLVSISSCNTPRDDRCVSYHGRELRHPYLDVDVVSFACALPAQLKCVEGEFGRKVWIRHVGKLLGIRNVEPKRAVQFGARSAKLDTTAHGHSKIV